MRGWNSVLEERMGLIGWVLLGGKFRCRGWSGIIAWGRGPKLRLKGDANQVWEIGGPPTRLGTAGWRPCAHLPGAAGGLWSLLGGGGRERWLYVARWHRPRFVPGVSRSDLPRELPGKATKNRPEVLGSSCFCLFFGFGCCFPTLRQYLGVN